MKLCLGTVQLGLEYGIKGNRRAAFAECMEILETALCKNGITTLDTAEEYGDSIKIIGEFLKRNPSFLSKAQIISKIKFLDGFRYDDIREKVSTTIGTLGVSQLDGLLLHNEVDVYREDVLEALQRLKQERLVLHPGVSIYNPNAAVYAATLPGIDYIQIPYNVMDRRLEDTEFFHEAKLENKTVFARSIFLQGLLLMENAPMANALPYVTEFHRLVKAYGYTPYEACINYVLGNDAIDYLVLGVDFSQEIEDNIHAMKQPYNRELGEAIRAAILCRDEAILVPSLWRKDI